MSLVVVALAIALRVAWVLAVPTKPVGDFAMYVESAAHLVEHGGFDSEYVYMPGYIFLIAPVQALGGGWLATKLVGAVLGGLGAGAVYGIARRMAGGSVRVAVLAGLLYACWPAGIAIASVTGTDMPAAVLVIVAAYFLVRFAGERPTLAAILFGVFTGISAYLRAVVVPLAALSLLVFRAYGRTWRASAKHAAIACIVALVVLSPWALRNHLRYGETFFTDSHGGLTALVGANPNTDGCYSRSLNRMFRDVTGFTLLKEPHLAADRAAMAIAKTWTAYDPVVPPTLMQSSHPWARMQLGRLGAGNGRIHSTDGGATWTGIRMTNTNPLEADGYWGLALTADRVRIVGDRDVTAYSSQPWTACSNSYPDTCEPLFTQANITPHYAFEDVFFLDKNHGWAAGTRTFSPQLWGQEIFATQDGGQTWTSQFERGLTDGLFSYFRLDSISFADANNGWAAGNMLEGLLWTTGRNNGKY